MVAALPREKSRDQVYAEIERAAQAFAGDTPQQRITAYIEAYPSEYARHEAAPPKATRPVEASAPLTLHEAEAHYRVSPSRESVWDVIEAKGRALMASDPKLTHAAAVTLVVEREPRLYAEYDRLQ